MHLRHTFVAVAAIALSLGCRAAGAQGPDTLAFHRGQWGSEFTVESGFAAAGLLHFRSPTRALLLDVGLGFTRNTSNSDLYTGIAENFTTTVRAGTRSYRSIGPQLVRIVTVGVAANYDWHRFTEDSTRHGSEAMGGGVFADIGAMWLVTPHLALGVKWGTTLSYLYARTSTSHTTQLSLHAGRVGLAGQLYF